MSGPPTATTRDDVADAFTASITHLTPLSDREGRYDHAPVRARTYVTDHGWPEVLAFSVRAVVFRRNSVVVVRLRDGYRHILPGGRREPGETLEEALRREVLEESGWHLALLRPLGFEHVQHLGAPRPGFPAFGFINPLYIAEGASFQRSARDLTQSEAGSCLVPIGRAMRELPSSGVALLTAATSARQVCNGVGSEDWRRGG
ncbi:NUDIX domain-containing protein [uncultured Phenylobacterium sp.]|uniref:NUDIX hydrolase n=1 Tax=uncultured Phenylobacterium sp. TaxID=349273 RepID=UPI0025EDA08B|nr:NUDIX domain-containing protein [uncultured Phenylobacterium sp.]